MNQEAKNLILTGGFWFQVVLPLVLIMKGFFLLELWVVLAGLAVSVCILCANKWGRIFSFVVAIIYGALVIKFIEWAIILMPVSLPLAIVELLVVSIFCNGCAYFLFGYNLREKNVSSGGAG